MKKIIYHKILVTHDGSRFASAALPYAFALADACKAQMLLFHVVETVAQELTVLDPMGLNPPVPIIADSALEVVKAEEKSADRQLERMKKKLEKGGITVKIKITMGIAGSEIVATAREERCDLIVMSTHGRSGLGRILLGSVADYVIRHARCPVLVVHPG